MTSDGFPPPPPPSLQPPPGAVGYQARRWGAVRLRRVGGLTTALTILLAVAGVGQILYALFLPGQLDNARDLIEGRIDEDTFLDEQIGFSGVSFLVTGSMIAIIVLTMVWLFRIASNHRSLQRTTTWGPGWAIGGWFLPPFLYVIPALMVREHWKAAEPISPPGDESWRRSPEPVLVWIWFVLYSVIPIILAFRSAAILVGGGNFGADAEDLADNLVDSEASLWAGTVTSLLAAIAWALVVRGLTARHRQLTGER